MAATRVGEICSMSGVQVAFYEVTADASGDCTINSPFRTVYHVSLQPTEDSGDLTPDWTASGGTITLDDLGNALEWTAAVFGLM